VMSMHSTEVDLSRYRQRIIDDAIRRFKGDNIFPGDDVVLAACEGLMDLLMEPEEARDPGIVRRFMEWLYNMTREKSQKTDRALEFLDVFEGIVRTHLEMREKGQVDSFFELCRGIVREKHKQLAR